MKRVQRTGSWLGILFLLGCSVDGFSVQVVFPDAASKEQTQEVRVMVVNPDADAACGVFLDLSIEPGDEGFPIEAELTIPMDGQEASGSLDLLSEGAKLFVAFALDASGGILLVGCVPVNVGDSANEVTISLQEPTAVACQGDDDCVDDGLWCNGEEVCDNGTCAHAGVDCDDEVSCTDDGCDEEADACTHEPNHGLCADDDACDGAEICDSVTGCQEGTALVCDDGDVCNGAETCDSAEGCQEGTALVCDDNDACNGAETCDNVDGCLAGAVLICDDNDACNGVETCDSVAGCLEGTAPVCDDNNVCNGFETCDSLLGCVSGAPMACDDGTFCNGAEICDPVDGCGDGPDPLCDDGIPCTIDSCDGGSDECLHENNLGGCPVFHIGPSQAMCPHDDAAGLPTTFCTHTGFFGLQEAAQDAPGEGAVFYLYEDNGNEAFFDSEAFIPGLSFVGAAPGIPPERVVLTGQSLVLTGNGVHLAGFDMLTRAGAHNAIEILSTGGHLIENIRAMAADQEVVGSNSITAPLEVGPDMVVRNCLFYGHWDLSLDLTQAHRSQIINNTFMPLQVIESRMQLAGVEDLVFANNVVVSLGRQEPLLAEGDLTTTGLVMQGNLFERYTDLVSGLDPTDISNLVEGNLQVEAQLVSPLNPVFLADADSIPSQMMPGQGQSLDRVNLEDVQDLLPGAYQLRSTQVGPRRTLLRLGDGDCGAHACDLEQGEDDELQKAVWASWPGGTIEIYPSLYSYSGFAIIHMPLTIKGMGDQPWDVLLTNRSEDPLLSFLGVWDRHDAMLIVLQNIEGAVRVENLGIFLDSSQPGDNSAVFVESAGGETWHELRRLQIGGAGAQNGLYQALYLGDHVLVQDVLINGSYHQCIEFGPRYSPSRVTPQTTCHVVNLTCRLVGSGSLEPWAAFGVASVFDTLFVNLVLESVTEVPLFMAQRRSVDDTDIIALDPPTSFEVHALTMRGFGPISDGFTDAEGTYSISDLETLQSTDPLFESVSDSHLAEGCSAIDSGVDPSGVDSSLSVGTSLDGLPRAAGDIDRGAFEQSP